MSAAAPTLPQATTRAIAQAFLPPSRWGNRYDHYYVRGKLGSDPLFPGALAALRGSTAPLLDVGCGLGLLAHALHADGQRIAYRGVDIDADKIARASRAAARAGLVDATFDAVDLTRGLPTHAGSVAILDVLQYLDADAQDALLAAAIAMLAPGARLVIRAALAAPGGRGRTTRITDWLGHLSGWMQTVPRHYPDEAALRTTFADAGLRAGFRPLYGNTPFNHWLIVAERASA